MTDEQKPSENWQYDCSACVTEQGVAALYRGMRYDNFRGKEIIDNTPVSRPERYLGGGWDNDFSLSNV